MIGSRWPARRLNGSTWWMFPGVVDTSVMSLSLQLGVCDAPILAYRKGTVSSVKQWSPQQSAWASVGSKGFLPYSGLTATTAISLQLDIYKR